MNTPPYDIDLTALREGQVVIVKEDTVGWGTVLRQGLRLVVRELYIGSAGSPVDTITEEDLAEDGPFDFAGASMFVCLESDPTIEFFIGYECVRYL